MKIFRLIIGSLVLVLVFAILAFAQTEKTQPITPSKIALFNYDALKDRKTGIKELADVYDKLEIEFKPQKDELTALAEKIQKLGKEIREIEAMIEPRSLIKEHDVKLNEYKLLVSKFESKQKEIKPLYEKRKLEIVQPINDKIRLALEQFRKEKDYAVIFDAAKLPECEIVNCGANDVTTDFIKYYNENFAKAKPQ